MADLISSISLQVAVDGRQALGTLSRVRSTPALTSTELPSALEVTRASGEILLGGGAGRTAVDRALTAGFAILSALQGLQSSVAIATSDGLTASDTALTLGVVGASTTGTGTRVSRLNISSALGRAVAAIDELVEAAAFGQANLISSRGRRVTIRTTQFGGQVTITPQALDAAGLNLNDLSTLSRLDAEETLSRIRTAVVVAAERLDNLETLQRSLGFASGFSQSFSRASTGGLEQSLPLGSFVNLVA